MPVLLLIFVVIFYLFNLLIEWLLEDVIGIDLYSRTSSSKNYESSNRSSDDHYDTNRDIDSDWWDEVHTTYEEKHQKEINDLKYSGPVDTSRLSHADQKYVDNLRSRGYTDRDINEKLDTTPSGCYIATASLQGELPISDLVPLKIWRYSVLERSRIGIFLSNQYRIRAPEIAYKISNKPKICKFVREFFVKPAIRILDLKVVLIRDIAIWILFLSLIVTAFFLKMIKE